VLVEWPERGGGALPRADLVLQIRHAGDRREIAALAQSERGESLLAVLAGRSAVA